MQIRQPGCAMRKVALTRTPPSKQANAMSLRYQIDAEEPQRYMDTDFWQT
jgi:hypothetical protein